MLNYEKGIKFNPYLKGHMYCLANHIFMLLDRTY